VVAPEASSLYLAVMVQPGWEPAYLVKALSWASIENGWCSSSVERR